MDIDKKSFSDRKRIAVRAMIASGKWHEDKLRKRHNHGR